MESNNNKEKYKNMYADCTNNDMANRVVFFFESPSKSVRALLGIYENGSAVCKDHNGELLVGVCKKVQYDAAWKTFMENSTEATESVEPTQESVLRDQYGTPLEAIQDMLWFDQGVGSDMLKVNIGGRGHRGGRHHGGWGRRPIMRGPRRPFLYPYGYYPYGYGPLGVVGNAVAGLTAGIVGAL